MREDIEALGAELEDDVPLRRLLWGPLVGPVLRSVEGDLVAPSPAVVGEEAEDGVLLRVLHAFHVCRHVGDVDGVLVLPFLCGGAWRGGGSGVPVESRPRGVGQVVLEGRPVSAGPLLASWVGWWRRRALDRCVQGARSRGGGARGGIVRAGVRGAACCGLELRRGEVHMMLRVLRVLEFQL